MNNKKQNKDVTLWVSIVMAAVLFFPVYGQMFTSCKSEKAVLVEGHDAEYWRQMYLREKKECLLWRNIAHQYWQYRDYDFWPDSCAEPLGRHNFFDDCISETDTYDKLYELLDGDFEDFFTDWDDHHEEISW